jgi:hypothetical protein
MWSKYARRVYTVIVQETVGRTIASLVTVTVGFEVWRMLGWFEWIGTPVSVLGLICFNAHENG